MLNAIRDWFAESKARAENNARVPSTCNALLRVGSEHIRCPSTGGYCPFPHHDTVDGPHACRHLISH